jgi:hypothetical protein
MNTSGTGNSFQAFQPGAMIAFPPQSQVAKSKASKTTPKGNEGRPHQEHF